MRSIQPRARVCAPGPLVEDYRDGAAAAGGRPTEPRTRPEDGSTDDDASPLDPRVIKILDVKCPGSGESHRNFWANLERLNPRDEIKFVIKDRADFDYALDVIGKYRLDERDAHVLFSPVWGAIDLKDLAAWILQSGVRGRMQLQLHKYIWGAEARGV